MSNVAIKLIAVTGVVGLGLLMFLQAQKGIQLGENENQPSQLEAPNEDDSNPASLVATADLTGVPGQLQHNNIPLDQVPAELSELASRNAAPLKKITESPFSPNKKTATPKIKLTAATEESTSGDLKSFTDSEAALKKALDVPVNGLDFRTKPKLKAPDLSENPFSDSVKTPTIEPAKTEPPTIAQTEFKTGPQFGSPTTSDSARLKGYTKTTIPPREKFGEKTKPVNPFDTVKTGPSKPILSPVPDQLAFREEQLKTKQSPAFKSSSPAQTLESNDSPFEIKKPTVPDTPTIGENPFQPTSPKPGVKKSFTLPAIETPSLVIEPKSNPFELEPAVKKSPALEAKPAAANSLPLITENNEKKPTAFPAESEKPSVNPFPSTIEKKPLSADESSDVVIIKKRQANPGPREPALLNINGEPDVSSKTAQPIIISSTPDSKSLSLVEGQQPELQAPAKLNVQQKIQSPKMTIQKLAPPEAVLGQPFIYHVLVKNTGTTSAQNVVIEDRIPQGAKLTGTIPRAEQMNDRLIWRLGAMDPGTEKKISIRVIPKAAGQIGSVATVNFVTKVASETKITAPQLSIKTDQPAAVKPGEITVVNYSITNSGTGDAKNVYLRSIIPPQFSHPGGDDIEYSVGIIPAGETKLVQLKLKAIKPGAGKNISSVMGDGNLKVGTEISLKVIGTGEQFLITRKGPKSRHLGQSGVYENVITNNSEKPIQNISVFESVPPGMKFVTASANGHFDTVRNVVQWDVPKLASGDRKILTIELEPTEVGKKISTIQVVTDNNTKYSANLQSETTIIGQPLLKVETSELKGPLAIGEKMTMQLQLINQGSASANNVEFRVKIPQELVFLSAKGPVRYKQVGSYVIFEPAQEMPAKQTLNFELSFAAQNKGDAKILVQVQSKQMEKPLSQEEAISVLDKL